MMKILNMEIFIQHRNFIHHSPVWSQIDLNLHAFGSYKRDISRADTHGGHERPNATVPTMCMACKCGLPAVCGRCTTQGSETTSTCFLQDSTKQQVFPCHANGNIETQNRRGMVFASLDCPVPASGGTQWLPQTTVCPRMILRNGGIQIFLTSQQRHRC